jgi:hypothetical protein
LDERELAYSLREAGLSTTSLGISANGVREAFGGVLVNGGGNPGGRLPAPALRGVGVLVITGVPGSRPLARNCSRSELGFATEAEAGALDGGGWYRG